jgi:hypothetical protein
VGKSVSPVFQTAEHTTTTSLKGGAMRTILTAMVLLLAVHAPLLSQKLDDKIADRLYESAKVFGEVLNAPDGGYSQVVA